jgi:hypothetical protein
MKLPEEGNEVVVTPSNSTREKKFSSKGKLKYNAKITEVNQNSVDLTIFGNGEMVFLKNIPHVSDTENGRSSWDYPTTV